MIDTGARAHIQNVAMRHVGDIEQGRIFLGLGRQDRAKNYEKKCIYKGFHRFANQLAEARLRV